MTSCGNDEGASDRCCVLFREGVKEGQSVRCLGYGMEMVFDSRKEKNFSVQSVKNVSGAHPASPLIGTVGSFCAVEQSLTSRLF